MLFSVNGGWTDWSLWSSCNASCGSGQLTRQRFCSNPQPANDGSNCSGEAIEHKSCQLMVCPGISTIVIRNKTFLIEKMTGKENQ